MGFDIDLADVFPPTPRAWFEQYRSPVQFLAETRACHDRFPAHRVLRKRINRNDTQYLLDAFTAGEFALIVSEHRACDVRLSPRDPPDFVIRFHDSQQEVEYETTEADVLGRETGREYREAHALRLQGHKPAVQLDDPEQREAEAREAISRVVRSKRHRVAPGTNLVVRNNLPALPATTYRELTAPWSGYFGEIWLLDTGSATRAWPGPSSWVLSLPGASLVD